MLEGPQRTNGNISCLGYDEAEKYNYLTKAGSCNVIDSFESLANGRLVAVKGFEIMTEAGNANGVEPTTPLETGHEKVQHN